MNAFPSSRSGIKGRERFGAMSGPAQSPDLLPSAADASPLSADARVRALAMAEARLEAARQRRNDYRGKSEHMRRKLDANLRAAEYDVAILRYALTGESAFQPVEND